VVRLVEVGTDADDGVASDGDGVVDDAIADSVDRATAGDDEWLVGVGLPQAATAIASRNRPVRDQVSRVCMIGRRYDRAVVAPLGRFAPCRRRVDRDPSFMVVSPSLALVRDPVPASLPIRRAALARWDARRVVRRSRTGAGTSAGRGGSIDDSRQVGVGLSYLTDADGMGCRPSGGSLWSGGHVTPGGQSTVPSGWRQTRGGRAVMRPDRGSGVVSASAETATTTTICTNPRR
jgi:hypothetical protein